MIATREFSYSRSLFDQFAQTHQIWSPNSNTLVLSGTVLDPEELPEEIESIAPGTWIVVAAGESPAQMMTSGVLAFWSSD